MESPKPLLKLVNICKQFGGIFVNDHISLDIMAGQVHALLGENGAGKSTLMNIVYGMYQPDAGQILVNGREVQIKSPRVSLENGIGMVHQKFHAGRQLLLLGERVSAGQAVHAELPGREEDRGRVGAAGRAVRD